MSPINRRYFFVQISGIYFSDAYGVGHLDNHYVAITGTVEINLGGAGFTLVFKDDGSEPYIYGAAAGSLMCSLSIKAI
jgi:hypothetical protein